eukprot:gene25462-11121_t
MSVAEGDDPSNLALTFIGETLDSEAGRSLLSASGFNWFLILAASIISILVIIGNIYLLIEYEHPEDKNQAWVPKIVIVFGLTLAVLQVMMYPLDVANTAACSQNLSPSSCNFTLPMYQLWLGIFIANLVLVWAIIPFTLFFYEADSDFTFFQKLKAALMWTIGLLCIICLIIGILYALVGYVIYPTQQLQSGTESISIILDPTSHAYTCIPPISLLNETPTSDLKLLNEMPTSDLKLLNETPTSDLKLCDAEHPQALTLQ